MSSHLELERALAEIERNHEQRDAVYECGHCIVLAGPGSGKTKTLVTSMARTLTQDVVDPRGVACITFNNECAIELESRLAKLGVQDGDRCFVGTVHSFALAQIITPYARCIAGTLPDDFAVASDSDVSAAVQVAHDAVFGDNANPRDRWSAAKEKRLREVDRSLPVWRGTNPELADFIEAYESELRRKKLIDFDDMPLIAFRMVKENRWIRNALRARFPVLFVDEYQDLGQALHELVGLLCFEGGIRLFAVGDVDQSIYAFTGANPGLLQQLANRDDVRTIRLRFNYRSGTKIILASLGALGEERDYRSCEGASDGNLTFWPVNGGLDVQAQYIARTVLPKMLLQGVQPDQVAILYRAAWLGDIVGEALTNRGIAFVRTDREALVRRNSRLARFVEACASWVTGGWHEANPPFTRLLREAINLVYGGRANEAERQAISSQLMEFLQSSIRIESNANTWLNRFYVDLVVPWKEIARNTHQEWDVCTKMIERTDPSQGADMPLEVFSGRIVGSGRITLSTLHSAKGREFEAVIMFGANNGGFPSWRDSQSDKALREARRLFYVGVTRPKNELCLVFQAGNHSPWVEELYRRSQQS